MGKPTFLEIPNHNNNKLLYIYFMKVVVLKTHLKEGLEIVERVATKSPSLPILSNVLISAKKEEVLLSATDLQIGITYRFLGTTKEEGKVVFPGRFVASLLAISSGSLTSSNEQVSLESEGGTLLVATGDHQARLKTLDAEEFPIIPSLEGNEPAFELETEVFCKGLNQVVGMTGQSQARPEISGVFFAIKKKTACVVATDSFRLAERAFVFEKEGSTEQNFILPAKTARELIAVLGGRPGKTIMYVSPSQAVFCYESPENPSLLRIQMVSRLIEGEYPHYEDVIPSSQKTSIVLPRADFLNHLKGAGIFAGKTQEVRLLVDSQKKEIEFFSENAEAGSHRSMLKGEIAGESVEVAFNWRFLGDGLAQMHGASVEFGINGEDGPALLRPSEHEGYRYVIMPIKA